MGSATIRIIGFIRVLATWLGLYHDASAPRQTLKGAREENDLLKKARACGVGLGFNMFNWGVVSTVAKPRPAPARCPTHLFCFRIILPLMFRFSASVLFPPHELSFSV